MATQRFPRAAIARRIERAAEQCEAWDYTYGLELENYRGWSPTDARYQTMQRRREQLRSLARQLSRLATDVALMP